MHNFSHSSSMHFSLVAALSAAAIIAAQGASGAPVAGLHAEFRSIGSANIGSAINGVFAPETFRTIFEGGTLLGEAQLAPASGFAIDASLVPASDNWAGIATGILDAPSSGRYTLSATLSGAFYLALDGRPVMQSKESNPTATAVFLEAGPHAIEIGLVKTTGSASLTLSALSPGAGAAAVIPLSWLSYDADGGSSTVVASDGASIYAAAGTTVIAANGQELASIGLNASASAALCGSVGAGGLYGSGELSIGPAAYAGAIASDADTGLDPAKTYTHLVSFPTSGGNATTPTVNGVTFDGRGTVAVNRMDGTFRENKFPDQASDYRTICTSSQYGCPDFVITLSGLTPGALYDFRYYWRTRNEHAPRNVTFVFYGQDTNGNTITNGVATYALEEVFGTGADKCGFIGCRYRAGADGKANLRVVSADRSSIYKAAFLYAVSNELLASGVGASSALALAPGAGERAAFHGTLSGAGDVTISGAGEQLLGGVVALDSPVAVESGRLVLANGANAASGVEIASGATVEMRGGARLGGLAGAGALDLAYGDSRLFGDINANGGLDAIPNFRIVHFTDDASSGISPSKKYLMAFAFRNGADAASPFVVNEIPFKQIANSSNAQIDFRTSAAAISSGMQQATTGQAGFIGLDSSQAMYDVLLGLNYPGRYQGAVVTPKFDGLTPGHTYEIRFYERNWNNAADRDVEFSFDPNGGSPSIANTVSIDSEAATNGSPYYIAMRFKASSSSVTVSANSLTGNKWQLYGATVEEVEGGATDRAFLDIAEDATFAGAVTGGGSVQKSGAGTLTLSGEVASRGFWYVSAGGLRLANANASIGEVAAGALAAGKSSFGGIGHVDGNVGIPGASTLVLGAPGTGGTLEVGGKVALGNGATVVVEGSDGALGACSAAAWSLPAALSIRPQARSAAPTPLFVCPAGFSAIDTSGWTIYKPNGSVNANAKVRLSGDGTALVLSQTSPFVMFIR